MKLKLQPTVLLLVFLLLASSNATASKTYAPGVAQGDYFTYEMYGVFTSNHSNTTMDIPQFEYNNTQWVKIKITSVEGSVIHQIYILHFKNESETELNFETNVTPANKNSSFVGQAVPICAANEEAGDPVPSAQLTINETVSRVYSGGSRETNHAQWNSSDDWGNCYFDRETGMLIEFVRTHRFTNNGTGEVIDKTDVINLISTNKWEINISQPPITLYFGILGVTVVALLSFILLVYKFATRKILNCSAASKTANYK
jgi:hypothetical protein